jgi:hypothetical protein
VTAKTPKADRYEYFAFLHDLGRLNDNHAPEHGCRAALIAENIAGDLIEVDDSELDLLVAACQGHSDGHLENEVLRQRNGVLEHEIGASCDIEL